MTRSFARMAVVLAVALATAALVAPDARAVTRDEVDQAVAALAAYKAGENPEPVRHIRTLLAEMHGQNQLIRRMEQKLTGLLAGEAGHEAKLQACQLLGRIGTAACIPTLEEMLADPKTAHMACWALQPNPSAEALAALRRGLRKANGEAAVAICGVLAHRRDEMAVPLLAERTDDSNALVAEAALAALGKIGTPKAAEILAKARTSVAEAVRPAATDAYLQCANRLAEAGDADRAAEMFETVLAENVALRYHRGALLALMRHAGRKAIPHVLKAIRGIDPMMKAAAIAHIPALRGEGIVERLARELPDQPPEVQALLVSALAERGGSEAREVVTDAADSKVPETRTAALQALARVGDASSVPLLAKAAGTAEREEEREAALLSLRRLQGEGVDRAVIAEMQEAAPALRAELIGVLHGRGTEEAVPALLDQAADGNADVRKAAFKALGHLAPPGRLPAVVDRLCGLEDDAARPTAERAVIEIARKLAAPRRADAVLAALRKTDDVTVKASLLRVLGNLGGKQALAAVTDALQAREGTVRDAAVRALGSWPDASAVPALVDLVKKTDNRTYRVVALRGSARLLATEAGVPSQDTLAAYKDLMALARRPQDKKLVLAGLADVPHPQALAMAADCLDQQGVRGEAAVAVLKIGRAVLGTAPKAVADAMEKLTRLAPNEGTRKEAREVLNQAKALGDAVMGWQVAGPLTKKGKNFEALFDTVFPPEQKDADADWRICPVKTRDHSPILALNDILGEGANRVAYVRTWIRSEKARPARLEAGSDDSIKIWLNDKLVHKDPEAGACTPGEHKVDVRLKQGWNTLMMKIGQNTGPWAFCARLVDPDGKPLDGITIDPYHGE